MLLLRLREIRACKSRTWTSGRSGERIRGSPRFPVAWLITLLSRARVIVHVR